MRVAELSILLALVKTKVSFIIIDYRFKTIIGLLRGSLVGSVVLSLMTL